MSEQDKPIEFICRVIRPWSGATTRTWVVDYNPLNYKKFPTKLAHTSQIIRCDGKLQPGQYLYAYKIKVDGNIGFTIEEYTLVYPTPESSELELANQVRNPDIWPNQIMEAQ